MSGTMINLSVLVYCTRFFPDARAALGGLQIFFHVFIADSLTRINVTWIRDVSANARFLPTDYQVRRYCNWLSSMSDIGGRAHKIPLSRVRRRNSDVIDKFGRLTTSERKIQGPLYYFRANGREHLYNLFCQKGDGCMNRLVLLGRKR